MRRGIVQDWDAVRKAKTYTRILTIIERGVSNRHTNRSLRYFGTKRKTHTFVHKLQIFVSFFSEMVGLKFKAIGRILNLPLPSHDILRS